MPKARHGRWAFLELQDPFEMGDGFEAAIRAALDRPADRGPATEAARWLAEAGGTSPDAQHIPRRRSAETE